MLAPETITKKDFENTLLRYPALLKAVSASKTGTWRSRLPELARDEDEDEDQEFNRDGAEVGWLGETC
jgi:hypothetical protein